MRQKLDRFLLLIVRLARKLERERERERETKCVRIFPIERKIEKTKKE